MNILLFVKLRGALSNLVKILDMTKSKIDITLENKLNKKKSPPLQTNFQR